jgi:5-methylthioadenosine/S-adenosylhomocysteine deaminase
MASPQGGVLTTFHIHSGTLVCMDGAATVAAGDLLVEGGVIAAVGNDVAAALRALPGGRAEASFDASNAFVLPGLVQGHLHLCQTLFRGLAEQSDLLRWLRESIWPLEAAHTPSSIAASARLGLCELIAGGVTCVNDMGSVRHTEAIGAVLAESGMRAVFGKALMDRGEGVPAALLDSSARSLAEVAALERGFHRSAGGRLEVALAPRFILSCSDALWEGVAAASAERGLRVHTHLAESRSEDREVRAVVGNSAARYFAAGGVLGPRFVAAHGVWLDPEELGLLRGADAALVHCPGSNLKLGSGLARVRAWQGAGLRRGIGCDGAACNNRLDPFHEMALAAGVSRVSDPERPLTAQEVVALATSEGARALGLGDAIGSLEVGKQADVIVVAPAGPHHGPDPFADPYVALVHAARPTDVRLTMVAGQVLYRDGAWSTLDAERVERESRDEARALVRRVA